MYTPAVEGSEASSPQRSRNSSILNINDSLLINMFGEEVKEQADCQERLQRLLNSWLNKAVSTLCALFAIFGDDIRQVATGKSADLAFDCVFLVLFGYFLLDLLLYPALFEMWKWHGEVKKAEPPNAKSSKSFMDMMPHSDQPSE